MFGRKAEGAPRTGENTERPKAVAAEDAGDGGFVIQFSDGTSTLVDGKQRGIWEESNNIPLEERLANLPLKKD